MQLSNVPSYYYLLLLLFCIRAGLAHIAHHRKIQSCEERIMFCQVLCVTRRDYTFVNRIPAVLIPPLCGIIPRFKLAFLNFYSLVVGGAFNKNKVNDLYVAQCYIGKTHIKQVCPKITLPIIDTECSEINVLHSFTNQFKQSLCYLLSHENLAPSCSLMCHFSFPFLELRLRASSVLDKKSKSPI